MISDMVLLMIRSLLVAVLCGFVWTLVKPKTQFMRVARAALLALCLLAALIAMRTVGV
jgi:hypothetical protein